MMNQPSYSFKEMYPQGNLTKDYKNKNVNYECNLNINTHLENNLENKQEIVADLIAQN